MPSDLPREKPQVGRPFRGVYLTPDGEQVVSKWFSDPDDLTRWYAELDRQHRPPPPRPLLTEIKWTGAGDRLEATFRTSPIDQRFDCLGRVKVRSGRLVITELALRSISDDIDAVEPGWVRLEGITGTILRKVPVGQLVAEIRRSLLFGSSEGSDDEPGDLQRLRQEMAAGASRIAATEEDVRARLRRGRQGYPDDWYRQIAHEYINYVNKHPDARGVIAHLADQHDAAKPTVRAWLRKARADGFLASTTQGKADASPGPRLYESTEEKQ